MEQILSKLDEFIRKTRPDYYLKLNPPLTEEEIKQLENKYNLLLPQDLKELYLWKNGQQTDCYESFVNNSEFVPLHEVLETAAELTSMIGLDFEIENWWNKNWLPIFHNGGGSRICYDMEGVFTDLEGQILEFWKADSDRNVIAGDLRSFLWQLLDYYEFVMPDEFDGVFDIEAEPGFPKKFYVE